MEQSDSCQRGEGAEWMKEGDGISQRTYMHDPQTQSIAWRGPEGGCGAWVEAGKGRTKEGKMKTSVIVSTIKIKFKKGSKSIYINSSKKGDSNWPKKKKRERDTGQIQSICFFLFQRCSIPNLKNKFYFLLSIGPSRSTLPNY